jgi:hypothetical protein
MHSEAWLTAEEGRPASMSTAATIAAIRKMRSNSRNLRVDGAFARDKVVVP